MFIQKVQAHGLAMGIIISEIVAWLAEKSLERLELELQQWAFVDIASAVDADLAAGTRLVVGLVVLESVGLNDDIPLAQLRSALDDGLQIRPAVQALTADKNRQVPPHLGGDQFLQLAAALKRQGGLSQLRARWQRERLGARPVRLQGDQCNKPPAAVARPVLEVRQRGAHRQNGLRVRAATGESGRGGEQQPRRSTAL